MYFIKELNESYPIAGLKELVLDTQSDHRGEIWTTYTNTEFLPKFEEDKLSISTHSVLRGLHGDSDIDKLITCMYGKIQLGIADLRKNSLTYGNSIMFELSSDKPTSILVPAGCVNGHLCLSDKCLFFYKWSKKYNGIDKQVTINYRDTKFNFDWKLRDVIMSERDIKKSINSDGVFL